MPPKYSLVTRAYCRSNPEVLPNSSRRRSMFLAISWMVSCAATSRSSASPLYTPRVLDRMRFFLSARKLPASPISPRITDSSRVVLV